MAGSPFGKWTSSASVVSATQMSPPARRSMPCICPSWPPKFQPSGGDSGLPLLSKTRDGLVARVTRRPDDCRWRRWRARSPGPDAAAGEAGDGGESAWPFGANLDRWPRHKESDACAPIMKLSPTQTLPSLSNINLPRRSVPAAGEFQRQHPGARREVQIGHEGRRPQGSWGRDRIEASSSAKSLFGKRHG